MAKVLEFQLQHHSFQRNLRADLLQNGLVVFVIQFSSVHLLSRVRLLAIPWTAAYQAPPSTGFSRQEYWSGVPLPSPRNLPGLIKMVGCMADLERALSFLPVLEWHSKASELPMPQMPRNTEVSKENYSPEGSTV